MNADNDLATETCEACRKDAPRLTAQQIEALLMEVPGWQWKKVEGIDRLEKEYVFSNFLTALAFTNKVGEMAEQRDHHPDILTSWGRVKLTWYTHAIGGLHRNDFRCAAASDQLYNG